MTAIIFNFFQMIIVVFGLPGTGKTFFAEQLAKEIKAEYLGSDNIRIEFSDDPAYSDREKDAVYQVIIHRLGNKIDTRKNHVVLDGTFYKKLYREMITQFTKSKGLVLVWFEMYAQETLIKARLKKQRKYSKENIETYEVLKQEYEPCLYPHLCLESNDENISQLLRMSKKFLQENFHHIL